MKKLLLACVCCGLFSSAAMAAEPYDRVLTKLQQRGVQIEIIRVANEKPVLASEETDEEVANIREELDALEEDLVEEDELEETS